MSDEGRSSRDIFGVAIVAALIALAVAFGAQRGKRTLAVVTRSGDVTVLTGTFAKFQLFPTQGRIEVSAKDGRSQVEIEMSLVVDGVERPLAMRRGDVHVKDKSTLVGDFPIELGDERATGSLELRMDPASDLVTASLAVAHEAGSSDHTYALRFGLAPEGRSVFVPGNGEIGDTANIQARTVVVDDEVHPFAFLSTQGPLSIVESAPDTDREGARPRLVLSSRTETAMRRATGTAPGKPARLDIGILVGASSQAVWGRLYQLVRVNVAKVTGQVTGSSERAHVIGLDEEGHPLLRTVVDPNGRFSLDAPVTSVQWIAALEAVHTSLPVRYAPGSAWELKLDVSAGGELAVKVFDADTKLPLITRLIVKGIDGTLDPSFGPDYRASGAGPLMDVLEGEVKTPLPSGRYRVSATRGPEWSIDSQVVEIVSGRTKQIELAPRHVVATPGLVGCDLHVHARPSFDSPVTAEDRVLSLVSAGIDFAVPTEHNIIGDYGPYIEMLRVGRQLSSVPGIEVTTYSPRFGHFGVFPYGTNNGVPPFKGTSINAVIAASRRGGGKDVVFQVNHPRLPQNIGYFNIINYDSKTGRGSSNIPQFDTLEVYNGYELHRRELTERVIEDWYSLLNIGRRIPATGSSDSHRIQYQWAGYPRTFAIVDPRAAGDGGGPIDVKEVVAAIKKGRSIVSSGPVVDFELVEGGRSARPGEELPRGGALTARLKVRAAPWLDVTSVEILGGTTPPPPSTHGMNAASTVSLFKAAVQSKPLQLGREEGTLEEAQARTLRFEQEIPISVPEGTHWVIAIARGERPMDDALPFMPIQPLAFTNPVYIAH
ncbi:MAG: PHP domain-containing protein [Labilithrix sp.]|nr:PHP domain-containing protein [Labilithrix sp.]MCW5817796.1 PHP domain-containing protein [Labilithrix sp.]